MNSARIKSIFVIALIAVALYGLLPTLQFYSMSDAEKQAKEAANDPAYQELKTNILNLGLDLQGGISLTVEIDVEKFLIRQARRTDDKLEAAAKAAAADNINPVSTLEAELSKQGSTLVSYFGSRSDRTMDSAEEIREALTNGLTSAADQALEIIRNRIDQFGVAEPVIQKLGDKRIIVEVAGELDPARVRKTVFTEANLQFKMVAEESDAEKLWKAANAYYQKKYDIKSDSARLAEATSDTTQTNTTTAQSDTTSKEDDDVASAEDLFAGGQNQSQLDTTAVTGDTNTPVYDQQLFLLGGQTYKTLVVLDKNRPILDSLMIDPEFRRHIRREVGGFELVFKRNNVRPGQPEPEYDLVEFVNARLEMDGKGVVDAKFEPNPQGLGDYQVSMKFDDKTSRRFSRLSEIYKDKQLAIILDGVVQSDPFFREKIPVGSRATISGSMNQEEARDLSIVLKTGSLPAPLKLIQQSSVGASLGAASVAAGTTSTIIGIVLVLLFMIYYYKKAGVIASMAVIINMVLIMSALAAFGGTLTLPGIAGIILTVGMSVDANVLIFERIREEIANGARVFSALENGYARATVAILDANITTFIAGVVLYSYGSGTIRGFALTLMIGILTSLITAVIMTRIFFEATTRKTDVSISV